MMKFLFRLARNMFLLRQPWKQIEIIGRSNGNGLFWYERPMAQSFILSPRRRSVGIKTAHDEADCLNLPTVFAAVTIGPDDGLFENSVSSAPQLAFKVLNTSN